MNNVFKRIIFVVLTVTLVFAAFPVTSAFAQSENPPKGELTNKRLERVWARQLKIYKRLGRAFEDIDGQISKFQARIDKAAENGRDVTALQAALDAFEAALNSAKPSYDSISSIVNTHQGFDANGKVTDAEKAKATLQDMRAKLKELKSAMGGTGKALREAWRAFREANKPATTPEQGT